MTRREVVIDQRAMRRFVVVGRVGARRVASASGGKLLNARTGSDKSAGIAGQSSPGTYIISSTTLGIVARAPRVLRPAPAALNKLASQADEPGR